MAQIPYWITQNLKTVPLSVKGKELSIYTFSQVMEGESPLGELGKVFVNSFIMGKISPYTEIWIFPKNILDGKISYKVGQIFSLVSRIKNDLALSGYGTISYDDDGSPIDWQPPNIQSLGYIYSSQPFLVEEAEKSFELSKFLATSADYNKHFILFNYLKELRCTDPYLGYLGLWSFIEIEWANDQQNTDMKRSLKNLLYQFFKDDRSSKSAFNKRLTAISTKVGQSLGESSIRNLLAHGKYHLVKHKWGATDNVEFHDIHDELFKIMLASLEENIRKNDL